jgi:hypothetical protein
VPPYHPDTPTFRSDWAQYYDHIERLDAQAGEVLSELAADGLAGNTIVFYFSDHGGIMPRSKRSVHESGTRVPLIVRFPEALRALAPDGPGRRTDRLVSFVDFAPSVLNLLEQEIPDYMQGMPFLGPKSKARREYVYMARDRMGPSPDLKRAVRNERFRYVRNYLPQLPAAQYNTYEPGIPSWAELWKLYEDGALNKAQRLMFEPQSNEELYDTEADPHEVNNLADQPEFEDTLRRLREAHVEQTLRIRDTAFLPEIEMHRLAAATTPYEFAQDDANYPLRRILKVVELASAGDTTNLPLLARHLSDENTAIQYWAAIGCRLLEAEAEPAREELSKAAVASPSDAVRMAAAEVLCWIGDEETGLKTLTEYLNDEREWVRFTAAIHLGWLGPKASAAKEILERHIEREPKPYPKQAAENALRYIAGKFTLPQ